MAGSVNVVLLFEGTDNGSCNPTIISDIKDIIEAQNNGTIVCHMVTGSGTRGGCLKKIAGLIAGIDSSEIVLEQYKWLTNFLCSKQINRNDLKVYVFGFSRGAYQACRFVDMLYKVGIPNSIEDCKDRLREYTGIINGRSHFVSNYAPFHVSYLGLVDMVKTTKCDGFSSARVCVPPGIKCRHALAIHEARKLFAPELLGNAVDEQWFAGVHSDLGRGYRDSSENKYCKSCHSYLAKKNFYKQCHKLGVLSQQTNFTNSKADTKFIPQIVKSWILKPIPFVNYTPIPNNLTMILLWANNMPFLLHNSQYEISNCLGQLTPRNRHVDIGHLHMSVRMLIQYYNAFREVYPPAYRKIVYRQYHNLGEGWAPILISKSERKLIGQLTTSPMYRSRIEAYLRQAGLLGATNPFA